jgi:hypothetical protein
MAVFDVFFVAKIGAAPVTIVPLRMGAPLPGDGGGPIIPPTGGLGTQALGTTPLGGT